MIAATALFRRHGTLVGNGLTQMNVDSYVRDMLTGAIVIAAVGVSALGKRPD